MCQFKAPAASPPGKEPPVINGQETRWASELVWIQWRRENPFPVPAGNRPQFVQPVA